MHPRRIAPQGVRLQRAPFVRARIRFQRAHYRAMQAEQTAQQNPVFGGSISILEVGNALSLTPESSHATATGTAGHASAATRSREDTMTRSSAVVAPMTTAAGVLGASPPRISRSAISARFRIAM